MVVLITGCRSGFGLLGAVSLAREGHTVYAGLRDLATAGNLLEASQSLPGPGKVIPVQLDVTREEERRAVVDHILSETGELDALVNNAGVVLGGFLEQVSEAELRKVFEVNVFGLWALTQACLPALRAAGAAGRLATVVNISSMSGLMGLPGVGVYAGSKWALEGMSEAWRHELKPFGVRVVLIEPGPYRTDIWGRNRHISVPDVGPDDPYLDARRRMEEMIDKTVGKRAGDPQEVVDRIVSLLADPRPALRYPMGPLVRVRLFLYRFLPFRLVEAIIGRVLRG